MHPMLLASSSYVDKSVQAWLTQRQEVIVAFTELCSLRPFHEDNKLNILENLQAFCQLLVDYISTGHFHVYEQMGRVIEQANAPYITIPKQLVETLSKTTQFALDFDGKYQITSEILSLEKDLSRFSEQLAERLFWEDKLLFIYTLAKSQQDKTMKIA